VVKIGFKDGGAVKKEWSCETLEKNRGGEMPLFQAPPYYDHRTWHSYTRLASSQMTVFLPYCALWHQQHDVPLEESNALPD